MGLVKTTFVNCSTARQIMEGGCGALGKPCIVRENCCSPRYNLSYQIEFKQYRPPGNILQKTTVNYTFSF